MPMPRNISSDEESYDSSDDLKAALLLSQIEVAGLDEPGDINEEVDDWLRLSLDEVDVFAAHVEPSKKSVYDATVKVKHAYEALSVACKQTVIDLSTVQQSWLLQAADMFDFHRRFQTSLAEAFIRAQAQGQEFHQTGLLFKAYCDAFGQLATLGVDSSHVKLGRLASLYVQQVAVTENTRLASQAIQEVKQNKLRALYEAGRGLLDKADKQVAQVMQTLQDLLQQQPAISAYLQQKGLAYEMLETSYAIFQVAQSLEALPEIVAYCQQVVVALAGYASMADIYVDILNAFKKEVTQLKQFVSVNAEPEAPVQDAPAAEASVDVHAIAVIDYELGVESSKPDGLRPVRASAETQWLSEAGLQLYQTARRVRHAYEQMLAHIEKYQREDGANMSPALVTVLADARKQTVLNFSAYESAHTRLSPLSAASAAQAMPAEVHAAIREFVEMFVELQQLRQPYVDADHGRVARQHARASKSSATLAAPATAEGQLDVLAGHLHPLARPTCG
jgi:hypothetical protein